MNKFTIDICLMANNLCSVNGRAQHESKSMENTNSTEDVMRRHKKVVIEHIFILNEDPIKAITMICFLVSRAM